jgi:transcriptional regulator with XRE-family HTH domain
MLAAAPSLSFDLSKEGIARSTRRLAESASSGAGVAAFCDALGLSKNAMSNLVRGKSRVRLGVLLKICRGAGVSPLEFLTGTFDLPRSGREVVEEQSDGQAQSKAAGGVP